MSVFNSTAQTTRAVPDPGTDHTLPPSPGGLGYGAMTSTSGLSGTNGVDTFLLNGDKYCQLNGNEMTFISNNRTHQISGNQSKQISGHKDETVIGNFIQQTVGNLHRTIIGATNDLFTATHTIAHKASQMLQEPVEYFHDVGSSFLKVPVLKHDEFITYQVYAGSVTQFVGTAVNFIGANADIKGAQGELIGVVGLKHGATFGEEDIEEKLKPINQKISALKSEIGAIQPAVYITMLHEVAITQKILVVGVNQYI